GKADNARQLQRAPHQPPPGGKPQYTLTGANQQPGVEEREGRPCQAHVAEFRLLRQTRQNPEGNAHGKLYRPAQQQELDVRRQQQPELRREWNALVGQHQRAKGEANAEIKQRDANQPDGELRHLALLHRPLRLEARSFSCGEEKRGAERQLHSSHICVILSYMKLIAQVKLLPDDEQQAYLLQTLEQANALCNWLSEQAWELQKFRRFDLQAACYHAARERSGLS